MNVPLIPMLFHIIEQPVRKFMSQKMAPTAAPGVYSYSCRPLRSLFVVSSYAARCGPTATMLFLCATPAGNSLGVLGVCCAAAYVSQSDDRTGQFYHQLYH